MYKEIVDHIRTQWPHCIALHEKDEGVRLGLPKPYLVQTTSQHFKNMFYWDTYFTNLGLLTLEGEFQKLAINHVENLCAMLGEFGLVPNSSLRVHESTSHSQPPYLSMMVRDIFELSKDKQWLALRYEDLKKEYAFWISGRSTPTGLQCFRWGERDEFASNYIDYLTGNRGFTFEADTYEKRLEIGRNFLAATESGWDFCPRFDDRPPDFLAVDLNCNLYVYEKNFACFSAILGTGEEGAWEERAHRRVSLINRYLWNSERGLFLDFDHVNGRHSEVDSLASFHPLWAGLATEEQAAKAVEKLPYFETPFGLTACRRGPRSHVYQWDWPNGWAPLHAVTAQGLLNYGYDTEARRIMRKYCDLVQRNFDWTGQLWEKYNAVEGSIRVGDEHSFFMPTLLGWTAGVFLWARERM